MTTPQKVVHHPACPDHDECDYESPVWPDCWRGLGDAVRNERYRAYQKHGENSAESLSWAHFSRWLSILMEEVGEVSRVVCELELGNITIEEAQRELSEELVQVGAMTEAWAMAVARAR